MGNWHCIPSSCAEVVYQEYLPPKIRWRYSGENWQEIIANDYLIEQEQGLCPVPYKFKFRYKPLPNSDWRYGETNATNLYPPFENMFIRSDDQTFGEDPKGFPTLTVRFANYYAYGGNGRYNVFFELTHSLADGTRITSQPIYFDSTVRDSDHVTEFLGLERMDGLLDNCGDCQFTVTKNGQVVHQETRSVCPEVEKLPCRLSPEIKRIEIEKFPYLEKIEVVPYQYSAYRQPGLSPAPIPIPQADPIPSECLNIYKNAIYVIPPSGSGLNQDATPFDSLVTQICSYPGCPRPEYQVLCDSCGCESCPGDTCPIECGNHICCYNDYGISIKEIPLSNYCGGQS